MRHTTPVTVTVTEHEVDAITCNSCGVRTERDNVAGFQEIMHFDVCGGYGSQWPGDMTEVQFDVCDVCLGRWTSAFVHPPEPAYAPTRVPSQTTR